MSEMKKKAKQCIVVAAALMPNREATPERRCICSLVNANCNMLY
jgi:hypothetical protein